MQLFSTLGNLSLNPVIDWNLPTYRLASDTHLTAGQLCTYDLFCQLDIIAEGQPSLLLKCLSDLQPPVNCYMDERLKNRVLS